MNYFETDLYGIFRVLEGGGGWIVDGGGWIVDGGYLYLAIFVKEDRNVLERMFVILLIKSIIRCFVWDFFDLISYY